MGGHGRSVLRGVAVGAAAMVWAGLAAGQSPVTSCWGVPEGARPISPAAERRFEVAESLPGPPPANAVQPDRGGGEPHPPLIAAEKWFSGEFWVPAADESEIMTYLERSIPHHQLVTTPLGSFDLSVASLRAVRQGSREDGLLVCLVFDPGERGDAVYPLPEALAAARREGMLSPFQLHRLESLNRMVGQRWPGLEAAWRELCEAPYDLSSRRRLFDRLTGFYDSRPSLEPEELAPEHFLDRDQRVRLRGLGHTIYGRCSLLVVEQRVSVELKACPLSQIASSWNHLARIHGGPALEAVGEERHDEVDALTLEVEGLSQAAGRELVFHLLEGLPGIAESPATPPPESTGTASPRRAPPARRALHRMPGILVRVLRQALAGVRGCFAGNGLCAYYPLVDLAAGRRRCPAGWRTAYSPGATRISQRSATGSCASGPRWSAATAGRSRGSCSA